MRRWSSGPENQTRDRYRPPHAPISDGTPLKSQLNFWNIVIVIGLLAMWLLDYPHESISRFIGGHFPWPLERSFRWPALVLERTLIEAAVCIPSAVVLAWRLPRYAVAIAALLAAVSCSRIVFEMGRAPPGSAESHFLLVIAAIHTALLVSATAYFAYLVRRAHADAQHEAVCGNSRLNPGPSDES